MIGRLLERVLCLGEEVDGLLRSFPVEGRRFQQAGLLPGPVLIVHPVLEGTGDTPPVLEAEQEADADGRVAFGGLAVVGSTHRV